MWHHRPQVLNQMSCPEVDASGRKDENSLLVGPFALVKGNSRDYVTNQKPTLMIFNLDLIDGQRSVPPILCSALARRLQLSTNHDRYGIYHRNWGRNGDFVCLLLFISIKCVFAWHEFYFLSLFIHMILPSTFSLGRSHVLQDTQHMCDRGRTEGGAFIGEEVVLHAYANIRVIPEGLI